MGIYFRGNDHLRDADGEPSVPYSSNNKVFDCFFDNLSTRTNPSPGHVRIEGQLNFSMYNNVFNQTTRAIGTNSNILVGGYLKGVKIYDNTFTKNDNEGTAWNFFFEFWYVWGGCEIYNNTFYGAATVDLSDIRKKEFNYGVKIYGNNFLVNAPTNLSYHGNPAITLEEHGTIQYAEIYDNYFKNSPYGVSVVGLSSADDDSPYVYINHINIHNNVFDNIGMLNEDDAYPVFMHTYYGDDKVLWDDISVDNNTMTANQNMRAKSGFRWGGAGGSATNFKIRNNIIKGFSQYPIQFYVYSPNNSAVDDVRIENNLYYNNASNSTNFGKVVVTNKIEQNNITADPLFTSSSDFHLQSSSSAIDTGVNIGLPYNGVAPDIGAFETGGVLGSYKYKFTQFIKKGITGEEVKQLQIYLNTHGYSVSTSGMGSPGKETNYFGYLTERALIKFQIANGLVGDGIVGLKTIEVLNL